MKKFKITVNGEEFEVAVEELTAQKVSDFTEVHDNRLQNDNRQGFPAPVQTSVTSSTPQVNEVHGVNRVTAPLPGNITDIRVEVGGQVSAGDVLMILEAMKMENEILSPINGKVAELLVQKGQIVPSGELLLVLA